MPIQHPKVALKVSLEEHQAELVRATQAAGGELPAALAKFRGIRRAELPAR